MFANVIVAESSFVSNHCLSYPKTNKRLYFGRPQLDSHHLIQNWHSRRFGCKCDIILQYLCGVSILFEYNVARCCNLTRFSFNTSYKHW